MSCCSRSCLATSRAEEPETSIQASDIASAQAQKDLEASNRAALEKSAQDTRMKTTWKVKKQDHSQHLYILYSAARCWEARIPHVEEGMDGILPYFPKGVRR